MPSVNEQIIVPRRDSLIITQGLLSQRFTVFFEELTNVSNLQIGELEEIFTRVEWLESLHNIKINLVDYLDGTTLYRGEAFDNTTLESAASWRIRKRTIQLDGTSVIDTFADGINQFEKVWDDRATYSYS